MEPRHEVDRELGTGLRNEPASVERTARSERLELRRQRDAARKVAADVAHELRNPLFGISSAAQLLRFRAREDPVLEKNIGRILREVERLNRMVTALLDYGRPLPIRLVEADPDDIWDDVLESNRGLLESRVLQLHRSRADAAAHPHPLVDESQLAQVFLNVLVNAVDAAPEATDLTLDATRTPDGGWRCRLHNGGPAIPPDALARAFDVLFSTKPGGTGIGLALCQRIIEEHGGTIALDTSDQGTTCTIVLPGP